MSANGMKLHSEEIYTAVLVWYLGPNNRQWVFTCVYLCVGVWLHIFFLHMGVIWSFVIPCLHTHTLLVFFYFVAFLFVWTKCTMARAKTSGLAFALIQSSYVAFSLSIPLTDLCIWHIVIYVFNGWIIQSQIWSPETSWLRLATQPVQRACIWFKLSL